ncbi:MAG: MotA/TolQ/ExbB proton channel family protein, partial [Gammaproteobacteria bacterium]
QKLAVERGVAFNQAPGQQIRLLQEALAARDAAKAASSALSDQYDNNEIRINELNGKLREVEAALGVGEVFGLARQVAGDTAAIVQQSLITAQFPAQAGQDDREGFLRQFTDSKGLPSMAELERVWFELQREMTESGKVVRFNTQVVLPDGTSVETPVVRIGPFTAMTDRGYVTYLPGLRSLSLLSRQPPEEFLEAATRLQRATGGYVAAIADPGRGVIMSLYAERPDWGDRIKQGHIVGYITIAVGVTGALLWVYQFLYLVLMRIAVGWQLGRLDRPATNNPLGRVLLAFKGDPKRIEEDAEVAELRISEAVLREVPKLERFQPFLRLAVAAGPLLGLIGTVVGMIITFQSITEAGTSDPKLMADGIGQAMIATVLGLGIAIPLLFANAVLASLSRTMVQILDEQSTGILAESIEKRRRA